MSLVGLAAGECERLSPLCRAGWAACDPLWPMVLFVATSALLALASLFGYLQPEMRKLQ
jgi:hypothetical protein